MFAKRSFGLLTLLAVVCFFGLSGIFAVNPNPVQATVISKVEVGTGLATSPTKGWAAVAVKGVKSAPLEFKTAESIAVKVTLGPTGTTQVVRVTASIWGVVIGTQDLSPAGGDWQDVSLAFIMGVYPGIPAQGAQNISVVVFDDGVESDQWNEPVSFVEGFAARSLGISTGAGLRTTVRPWEWKVRRTKNLSVRHLIYTLPRLWVAGATKFRARVEFTPASGATVVVASDWRPVGQFFEGQVMLEVGHLPAGTWTRRVFIEYDESRSERLKGDKDFTVLISE
jgi:hypothetical protein